MKELMWVPMCSGPNTELDRILKWGKGARTFWCVGKGHGEAHEFWIVRYARIELQTEIVDATCFRQCKGSPDAGIVDTRQRTNCL